MEGNHFRSQQGMFGIQLEKGRLEMWMSLRKHLKQAMF